ncbi:tetratricopeptide repeat protein [Vibrio hippocampi]|uniref:MSHA biogenesis protein MshN n=1 Tax=Vibrio hippocampi TaxID=654686 RepID=A0ABM8ZJJ3_9VIBR|nr:tetratricopeptide repeat protein [Vibrio hippocampi]CAH0526875.1 hypothetical protein VHP8226_02251 [Vibrio hippocampi]
MSAINKALSELNQQQDPSKLAIKKAEIPTSNRTPAFVWVGVGFAMSVAMGGWAISQADSPTMANLEPNIEQSTVAPVVSVAPTNHTDAAIKTASPTVSTQSSPVTVYALPKAEPKAEPKPEPATQVTPSVSVAVAAISQAEVQVGKIAAKQSQSSQSAARLTPPQSVNNAATEPRQNKVNPVADKPVLIAQVTHNDDSIGQMIIEQVELSPEQLAEKAVARAKKSLDSNDIDSALAHYEDALRYTASNEQVRQQLAALYYGKGQINKAYQLLEDGINRNTEGEGLRIALTKLLIKEQQQEAALTPLVYLPNNPSQEYLSLRAGLAQRNKQTDLAYESYQLLTVKDRLNARWWMGLAIQQERKMEFAQAKESYQKALNMIGISSQSKAFIRDRLKVLASLEESGNAN